jgi:hypothetical protein
MYNDRRNNMDKKKFWNGFVKGFKLLAWWFLVMTALTAINAVAGVVPATIIMCVMTGVAFGLIEADMI